MRRENEYRQLANSVRGRAAEEKNALLRAQWEILAGTYVQLADQSKKVDDTGTFPLVRTRRRTWPLFPRISEAPEKLRQLKMKMSGIR